jgi:small GTP-binding protein
VCRDVLWWVEILRSTSSAASTSGEARRVKILMFGDSGVGKSSLIIRWTQDTFSTDLVGTVGVNFKTRKIQAGGCLFALLRCLSFRFMMCGELCCCYAGEHVQVQVWDTAGQEQFHKITTSYYKGANGIMLVYDVSDRKSVENVEYWVKNIKSHASESVHVCLIGNKVDLRLAQPQQCCDASFGQNFAGNCFVCWRRGTLF